MTQWIITTTSKAAGEYGNVQVASTSLPAPTMADALREWLGSPDAAMRWGKLTIESEQQAVADDFARMRKAFGLEDSA